LRHQAAAKNLPNITPRTTTIDTQMTSMITVSISLSPLIRKLFCKVLLSQKSNKRTHRKKEEK
ncbi:MAG: hypothetical protein ACXADX_18500, partial [Candidatus Hodarchaeales archaeon]